MLHHVAFYLFSNVKWNSSEQHYRNVITVTAKTSMDHLMFYHHVEDCIFMWCIFGNIFFTRLKFYVVSILRPDRWISYPCHNLTSLQWRHNELDNVSNHQPRHCLLSHLFGCRSKKTSKLRVTGLCAGNSPGTGEFPARMASYAENVSTWWRHHVNYCSQKRPPTNQPYLLLWPAGLWKPLHLKGCIGVSVIGFIATQFIGWSVSYIEQYSQRS